ncbi:MAG TPA: carbamate kinase [Nitrospirota bacterium]
MENRITIVTLGGNAIIRRGETGTVEEQFAHADACMAEVAKMLAAGRRVIITHGNGPIVGNIVIRNECARNTIPPMPLFMNNADSEGGIGFMIQQTLYNSLRKIGGKRDVATIITQVVVDENDPAFLNPTKPIGPYYRENEADALRGEKGWTMAKGTGGYRRAVPSPRPVRIIEKDVIRRLALEGIVVIAAGGGGVPVLETGEGLLRGVDAVIDKDLSTSALAREIRAEGIIILTEVDRVYLNYGAAGEKGLDRVSLEEMKRYFAEGHFPPGSMGPKIEAAIEFLEAGGREVVITRPELMGAALAGRAGTRISG